MRIGRGNQSTRRKPSHYHLVHHQSHMIRPRIEPGAVTSKLRLSISDGISYGEAMITSYFTEGVPIAVQCAGRPDYGPFSVLAVQCTKWQKNDHYTV
jgi:hypothetical protein